MTVAREEWAATVVLADGETAFIRPITPTDAATLLAFHERQPRDNLYRRFFSHKPTLSEKELDHFTVVDFLDRVALVMEQRGEFIAWASYERWQGRDDADVAFMVDDAQQGKGIATLMLEHLAAIARSNGIGRFTAEVLSDNRPMLRVFSRAGWPVTRHFDSGVTEMEFPLVDTEKFVDSVASREHRADSRAVARLLLPRSIAVIGASDTRGSIGREIFENSRRGFDGPVYPVNPRRATIGGERAYASVLDIEDDVWLALVAVPAKSLAATLEECAVKRVRGAVVITAIDGVDIDMPAIVDRARRNGLRIIGPASMGIASPRQEGGLQGALVPVDLPSGGIAISMQSGTLGASLLQLAAQMSLGISWFVSLGDRSDVSGNDLLQFWEDDEQTRVIAMYTETFGNPRKFARIARRVSRTRPIVAVRTGAAAIGQATTALYQQAGLIEVPTVRALLDTARVLATQPIPKGPSVAILTNARSPGVLAHAAVISAGLTPVDPPEPLDWRAETADYATALAAAIADPAIDAVLVIHAPPIASAPAPIAEIDEAASGSPKPVVAVLLGRGDGPIRAGSLVPSFSFPEPAAAALGRLAAYSWWLNTEADASIEAIAGIDTAGAELVLAAAIERGEVVLGLDDAAEVLAAYGLSVPRAQLIAADAAAAVSAAEAVGFPVALKVTRRRVGRSAKAGIALDLVDDDAVHDALGVIIDSLGDDVGPIVVQQMVPPGVDVRIRCTTDPSLGPLITVGLGGAQADAIGDGVSRLAPVSLAGAEILVRTSRVGAALASSGLSPDRLVDAIMRVGQLISDHHEIIAIEANPVIVSERACHFTDARVEVQHPDRRDHATRRLT